MAHLRPSLHKTDGLPTVNLLLRTRANAPLDHQSHSNNADHILRSRPRRKRVHEKQKTVEVERLIHDAQSGSHNRKRDNAGAIH